MRRVAVERTGLGLAAVLIMAASLGGSALFEAPRPGADLEPKQGAAELIELLQGQRSLLWSTRGGAVEVYEVLGWPSSHHDAELGGALMIRKPADGTAGVIDFGEKPKSAQFELSSR